MRAVVFLEELQRLNELIDAKKLEREQLWERATSLTPNMDGMPHASGVSDKVGNAAALLAQKADEINEAVDMYIDHRDKALALLELLPSIEYVVLHRHYVMYRTMDTVAQEIGKTERQAYRIKSRGLKHLQAILDDPETFTNEYTRIVREWFLGVKRPKTTN